ncbi:hypothetical protein PybrP1_000835 [[Pythium] brassicae (nom. inval.)]|nr:hypothetical protein PybrP1_000835 [[Pythium] brassicae (nom. inval.)]
MEPNQQLRGDELEVRQALLYTVGSICDDEVLATELQHFAHHAGRKSIKPEDVLLCARRHPSAVKLLQKYQREQLGATGGTSGGGARRRLRRPRADSDDL